MPSPERSPGAGAPLHFLDFEGDLRSGVVEYGVVIWSGPGQWQVGPHRICQPVQPPGAAALALHGLDAAATARARPFNEDWAIFSGLRAHGLLAAHFASAEHGLLRAVWPYPPASPDFAFGGPASADWGPWIDTARLARRALGPRAPLELGQLVEALGCGPELHRRTAAACPPDRRHPHAALYDAVASATIFDALLPLLASGAATFPSLAQLALWSAPAETAARFAQPGLF